METKVKTLDNKRFKILVRNVELNTSYNLHSEALIEIAHFFGYNEYVNLFKEYSEKDNLTLKEFNTRYEAKERMFFIIQAEYGSEVVKMLEKAM